MNHWVGAIALRGHQLHLQSLSKGHTTGMVGSTKLPMSPLQTRHAQPATAGNPTPALRRLEHFVMLKKADADRPHQFTFRRQQLSDGSTVVVMDYKHWVFETENWNTESHVVFNYKPKLEHIKPAMLRQETVNAIKHCKQHN